MTLKDLTNLKNGYVILVGNKKKWLESPFAKEYAKYNIIEDPYIPIETFYLMRQEDLNAT